MGTVTPALHGQPDRCVRGTPFAHHLISAVSVEGVAAGPDDAASAGRFVGADSDVASGMSALSWSRPSVNRTLFNARPVSQHHK